MPVKIFIVFSNSVLETSTVLHPKEKKIIKTMKKYGANVLALESGETIIVNQDEMVEFANKNKMIIVAI